MSFAVMVVRCGARLERFDDPQRHRHPEIGADEHLFELIPIHRLAGEFLDE